MTDNKTSRSTISFLIVRDHAHELAYAKALESLGVNWGKILPIPNFDATQFPEVRKLMEQGLHLQQHHFRLDGSEMAKIFSGSSPASDGNTVVTTDAPPVGVPLTAAPERPEEFAPGLPPEFKVLVDQIAALGDGLQ